MQICFVGDSFVAGVGDESYLGWTGRLCAEVRSRGCDVTHYNLGIRRETTRALAERWRREVGRRLREAGDGRVVFCFGGNDVTMEQGQRRVPLQESLENTRDILEESHETYPTLMVGPVPIDDPESNRRKLDLSDRYSDIARSIGVPYRPLMRDLSESENWMDSVREYDGIHPVGRGYETMARILTEWEEWQHWFNLP